MWCQQQDDSVTWFSLLLRATSCESPATWCGRERNLSELRERTVWTRDMLTRDLASTNWKYQGLIWSPSVDNEVRWRWLIWSQLTDDLIIFTSQLLSARLSNFSPSLPLSLSLSLTSLSDPPSDLEPSTSFCSVISFLSSQASLEPLKGRDEKV